jgi:hypothetical protein
MKTKKLLMALLMILYISSLASAQTTFQKTYGGANYDIGSSIMQTTDGGFIIVGSYDKGTGFTDVYLIRITANGDTLWTKTYGGSGNDEGISVQQTSDGGYIIAGYTDSFGVGNYDVYLIRTNPGGDTLWTKTYGGINWDMGRNVKQTFDGGYIICGHSDSFGAGFSDIYLIRTDSIGNALWTKTYGGTSVDLGSAVQQTTDSGFIIAGYTFSFGAGDQYVYLIRTDANGTDLWSKTYGGTSNNSGSSVQQTSDGGYIIAGGTSFGAGNADVYLIKTDTVGDTLWTKTFGGTNFDEGYAVQQTIDSGYIIAGVTESFGVGNYDIYLIKTDINGDSLWTKTFGGSGNDDCGTVQQTSDGGYIIAGYSESFGVGVQDVYVIKTDSNGNSGCNQGNTATLVGTPATQVLSPATIDSATATIVNTPISIVGSGGTVTSICITVGINEISSENSLNIFPNPATNNITIETPQKANIMIINLQGQIINTLQTKEDKTTVDVSALPGGVYIIKLNTADGSVVRKFVKD